MPKPNFFLVGAPRCGTRSMYKYLRAHPDIFMPVYEKEPHYFGTDLVSRRFSRYRGDEEAYLTLFNPAKHESRIGEASVWYLYSRLAAQEIHAFDPNAKIIIMLRFPLDMMYSLYYDQLYSGDEDLPTFEEALDAEADRRAGKRIPKTIYRTAEALHYRNVVRFGEQVQRYLDVFGPEQVRVIIFEEFAADTPTAYRDTLSFLGVDPDFQPEFVVYNANRRVKSDAVRSVLRNPVLVRLGHKIRPISLPIYARIRSWNTETFERSPMNPDTRQKLLVELHPEIERMEQVLGREITVWRRKE
jgi:hypothetical protein